MSRIPLSLVTGFLGSGKTTFLKQTARRLAGRRIVYLVNEFSSLDVDGAVLGEFGPNVVSIPGGSIFCKCLVGEFILNLEEIPRRFATRAGERGEARGKRGQRTGDGQRPSLQHEQLAQPESLQARDGNAASGIEGVIIEASGVTNPKVIADMLRETRLDGMYDLAGIVSVVDPGSFHKLLATLPNIRAQIEAADIVLLNKIDLFSEEQVVATEAAIRQIRPAARIIRTVRGTAEVDLFGARSGRELHGAYAECADPHYGRYSVVFHNAIDLNRLEAALRDLGDVLYRAKGFVPTLQGAVYLDWSTAGLSIEPRAKGDAPAGLAIIARADSQEQIEAFIGRVKAGALNAGA